MADSDPFWEKILYLKVEYWSEIAEVWEEEELVW